MSIPVKPNKGPARAADQSAVDVGAAAGIHRVPVAGRRPPVPALVAAPAAAWRPGWVQPVLGVDGLAVVLAVAASPQAAMTFSAGQRYRSPAINTRSEQPRRTSRPGRMAGSA